MALRKDDPKATEDVTHSIVGEMVRKLDFKEIIEQAVDKRMNYVVSTYDVEGRCEEVLKTKINGEVEKKLKELLN